MVVICFGVPLVFTLFPIFTRDFDEDATGNCSIKVDEQ